MVFSSSQSVWVFTGVRAVPGGSGGRMHVVTEGDNGVLSCRNIVYCPWKQPVGWLELEEYHWIYMLETALL